VLVLSSATRGASLAAYDVQGDAILLEAQTPYVGQPHRWLNPAGIADFDGDGALEVAFVAMPHLVKRLEVWTLAGNGFEHVASLDDVSNHRLDSSHIGMAAVGDFDGNGTPDLAVPNGGRDALRLLGFAGGKAREIARLPLGGAADGAISARPDAGGWIFEVPLENGRIVRISFRD
jgi:hypothetical protein